MKSPKVWSLRKELWSLRKVAGCWMYLVLVGKGLKLTACLDMVHPWRPRGDQSGWEKWCTKSFQAQAEKPLGTHSHWTISKCLSERCAQSANSISWVSEDDIVYNTSVNRCSMIVRASIVQNRTAVDND